MLFTVVGCIKSLGVFYVDFGWPLLSGSTAMESVMERMGYRKWTSVPRIILWECKYWLLPVVALATLVRFHDLTEPTIWFDEAFSALLSAYPPSLIWFHAAHDVHPPLYYLLLHGWMAMVGNGVFAVRSLSVFVGVVTVVLGAWLACLVATRRAACLATLLLALLPIAVRYSQEVRMYALLGVWTMGATIALYYWVKNPQRHHCLILYVLLIVAGLYTHYFAAFCLLSHWLYLLFLFRFEPPDGHLISRSGWWLANGAMVILYLPWVPELIVQFSHSLPLVGWVSPPSRFSLPSMIWQFLTLNDGLDLPWLSYVTLPLMIAGASVWLVWHDTGHHKLTALLVMYTWAPALVVFFISFQHSFFNTRYFVFAASGLPLILAITVDQLMRRYQVSALLLLVLLLGMEGVGLSNVYAQRSKLNYFGRQFNDQVGRTVEEINQRFEVGDRIVVDAMFWYLSVLYYNKTSAQPQLYAPAGSSTYLGRGDERGGGTFFYQDNDSVYLYSLGSLPPDTKRVWLMSASSADGLITVPHNWRQVSVLNGGDTQVKLYVLCSPVVATASQSTTNKTCTEN
ncbi:glycosyltransferase family 39 protein [Pseudomonas sp. NA-150]|uniref:glycosyltransferase family 39 protein n=1 Tax=Pseudomonas sp. NA-150 TaxID=3367525 RepID=UPI0037C98D7C